VSPAQRQEQIADTELLFQLAVKSLDASAFPESVRTDLADEAAIQLKHVLDYVFTHSQRLIDIPDVEGMKRLNDKRTNAAESWHIPGTAISLTSELDNDPDQQDFFFSEETVASISEMYQEVKGFPVVDRPFATLYFYQDFFSTWQCWVGLPVSCS
jgi:MscS family membrane protein